MTTIPILRAAHLLLYVDVLREIGAPVDRDLGQSRLPGWIEEAPQAYVSLPLALDWLGTSSRDVSITELGYLAARKMSLATLDPALEMAVMRTPTTHARIDAIARLVHLEDSALTLRTRREGPNIRIICDMPKFRNTPNIGFAEWLNLEGLASLMGAGTRPGWHPLEMTFVCPSAQSDAALEAYGNTRILLGQPLSSILVSRDVLATADLSYQDDGTASLTDTAGGWDFNAALRSVLRPYLGTNTPTLALAAELSGMSARTLQRRLAATGKSYSQVLEETRLEIACAMLAAPDTKIIDVALASGYENPQHFSRAFRRMSGMAPKTYRSRTAQYG